MDDQIIFSEKKPSNGKTLPTKSKKLAVSTTHRKIIVVMNAGNFIQHSKGNLKENHKSKIRVQDPSPAEIESKGVKNFLKTGSTVKHGRKV